MCEYREYSRREGFKGLTSIHTYGLGLLAVTSRVMMASSSSSSSWVCALPSARLVTGLLQDAAKSNSFRRIHAGSGLCTVNFSRVFGALQLRELFPFIAVLVSINTILQLYAGNSQWCKQDQILKTKTKVTRPRPRPLLTRPRPKWQDQDHLR